MRLAQFIVREMESILVEWEEFASSCAPPQAKISPRALRDHAKQILQAVSLDLETPQTAKEQHAKSTGDAPLIPNAPETAAQTHAVLRAKSGFDINELVSEYRALRASVVRLWTTNNVATQEDFFDFIRFNEAIDQAIAESIEFFDDQLSKSRNLSLGMLGHDLRTPLGAIAAVADCLVLLDFRSDVTEMAFVLKRSSIAMQSLLNDLVDLNRTQLGLGINIDPSLGELGNILSDELLIICSAHPGQVIQLKIDGKFEGYWDPKRVQQILRNLVVNAVKYGQSDTPVSVSITGSDSDVEIQVTNRGTTIDPDAIHQIFEPLNRAASQGESTPNNLGLGLFIVKQLVTAHGGDVQVISHSGITTFKVRLPRWHNFPPAPISTQAQSGS